MKDLPNITFMGPLRTHPLILPGVARRALPGFVIGGG